jgi:hypothetical protein
VKWDKLPRRVDLIKCKNLTPDNLVANNDINTGGICVVVKLSPDRTVKSTEVVIADYTWHFLLNSQVIRAMHMNTPAQTAVRAAFKSMEYGLPHAVNWYTSFFPFFFVLHMMHCYERFVEGTKYMHVLSSFPVGLLYESH